MPTRLGTIYRGSTRHRILAELERYPDTWHRWYQFPTLNDVHKVTIHQAITRLVSDGLVAYRRVKDEDTSSGSKRRIRQLWYGEIRYAEVSDAAH